jgi:hypothetical protein
LGHNAVVDELLVLPSLGYPGRFSFRVLRAVLESLRGVKFFGDLRSPPNGLAYTIGAKPGHLKNLIAHPMSNRPPVPRHSQYLEPFL